jgi:phenylpropionate dioxygenase-like ring-hydroxylating dioxygenase large terminal subunit
MLVTKQPVLRRFWYPVMRSSQLNGEPEPFQLLGSDIVLWRGANGEVTCFQDRCRHRTAKLSLGFIEDGRLVCGYHGWSYRPDGVCVGFHSARTRETCQIACASLPIAQPSVMVTSGSRLMNR